MDTTTAGSSAQQNRPAVTGKGVTGKGVTGKAVTGNGAGAGSWDAALVALYMEHSDNLVAQLMSRFADQGLAEDAVQEAFLAFHLKGVVPAAGCELAYLATAARNKAFSIVRREARRREIVATQLEVNEEAASAEDRALEQCEVQEINDNLAELPRQQANVVRLRHLRGLSVKETADQLGVTNGTVKTHNHRGLQSLRSLGTLSFAS